jgi:hypothetical protein
MPELSTGEKQAVGGRFGLKPEDKKANHSPEILSGKSYLSQMPDARPERRAAFVHLLTTSFKQ